ncbi:MAG: tryptophan-rich sensory protein [Oscillospiraceae bacterium]|nr:tryptophan-rich sensory protein [Oscillospiraceae bacterium]
MKHIKWVELLIYVISAELVGALSGIASGGNFGEFYQSLQQPPFAPPGWLFPIAWVLLYALMGISAYLIHMAGRPQSGNALKLYWIQLAVNFLWSPVFFRFHSLGGAAVVILVLLLLVTVMAVWFWRIRRSAGLLNIPYVLWTAYASYLTLGILKLNS